jgi:hypothetical protein
VRTGFPSRLQVLHIGRSAFVEDHEIHRELLHPPVLMGLQQLPHDRQILDVARSAAPRWARSPEMPWLHSRRPAAAARMARGPQRGIREQHVPRQLLEQVRLLGVTPRWRSWTCAWVQASVAART